MSRIRSSVISTAAAFVTASFLVAGVAPAPSVASAAPQPDEGSGVSVISEGEVRFADRLVDGRLELGLRDVSTEDPQWLDPSQTIIHLPNQDSDWLCRINGSQSCRTANIPYWEAIAPNGSKFWTTKKVGSTVPGNALAVNLDAGLVPTSQVNAAPQFTFGGLETAGDGYFVMWPDQARPTRSWDSRDGLSNAVTAATSETGAVLVPSRATMMTFSAEGVYHLTINTSAYAAADGATLTDTAVFTIVVGDDTDPTAITPAPQPDEGPGGGDDGLIRDDGVAVFAAGDVRIAPVMEGDQYSLRIADHRGASPQVLDAKDAIFYLPNQDPGWPGEAMSTPAQQQAWDQIVPRGTAPWRTRGNVQQSNAYASNDLVLSLDGAHALSQGEYNSIELQSSDGPGDFTSYRVNQFDVPVSVAAPVWDSRSLTSSQSAAITGQEDSGWAFTAPGQYCITLRSTLGDRLAAATFTVVVGEVLDPREVSVCEQQAVDVPDIDDGETGEELDPTITYLDHGHTDLAVDLVDDELRFGVDVHEFYDLDDTIWVGQRPANKFTVPTVAPGRDYTFIGAPGSTYWGFTQLGTNQANALWPGLSTQGAGLASKINPNSVLSFSLLGVSGPGDVVIFSDDAATGTTSDVYWSSAQGYPQSRSFERGNHSHMNWAFTEQGVYCLNWQATMRLEDDSNRSTSAQLTVVVGDEVDLADIQPCGRDADTPAPVGTIVTPSELSTDPVLLGSGQALIAPYLDEGSLEVFARVQDSVTSGFVARDVESLIFSATRKVTGGPWNFDGWMAGNEGYSAADISWDTAWLDQGQLSGDPTLSIGDVQGPGNFSATRYEWLGAPYILSENALAVRTDPGGPSSTTLRAGWRERHVIHSFSAPGVYCVPITWKVDLAGGGSSSVSKTLTFVAGSTDPASADYVDRSALTPCADGGEATDPGDDEPGGGETTPPVDDTPDSDATVLSIGHVDLASLIEGGQLVTKVKDDTTGSEQPVFRELDDVVFHVTSLAERPVPAGEEFGFLGAAGASTWLLPATQDNLLLWPGWSTELIPREQLTTDVTWRLTDVAGPGEFALFETGTFGEPLVRWDTRDGITAADSFPIPPAVHAHGNWAFSAEGVYCVAFDRSATLTDGGEQTVSSVLAVAVGDVDAQKVDPSKCFTEPEGRPDSDDSSPIALDQLTDGNTGGVQVLGGENGFTAGQLVTTQVAADRAGRWVSVWLDDASWLGWVQVGASGAIQIRLPADAAVRAHVLVVKDREGTLIGWDALSVVAAGTDPGGGDDGGPGDGGEEPTDPAAVWDVVNGTVNEAGATVLNNGHVDVASLVNGGALQTQVKDTTQPGDPVFRDAAKTVLQLLPNARTVVPSGIQWSFLGEAGSSLYQVSQTQQAGLLWPGWSTESIPLSATHGGVDWKLTGITGPGEFALYETGSFGQPSVLFSTRDGITSADAFMIPKNTHAHGSWAFSAQGNYCLAFERSATLASGAGVSDRFVLAVAVGRADVMRVDPTDCFQTPDDKPTSTDRDPIANNDLTDAAKGDVTALDKAAGFVPGQLVSVQVGQEHADEWVSVWLHSDPAWLGWAKADTAGTVQVRLPANAPLGSHNIVVKAQDGSLLGWDSIMIATATPPEVPGNDTPPGDDTPAAVQVPSTQCVAGATILSSGHIDYASRIVGGQLESLIGDDTSGTRVYREPSGTILWLKPSSRVTLPSGYGQVGAAGSSVWQVPQTQNPDLIWLGWNTESLNAGNTRGPVSWTIDSIDGPGALRVYLSGSFGGVQQMVFAGGGSYSIPLGVHAHANWAFSAEGIYRITTTQTATLANGQVSSDTETLTIVVGSVDPASAAGTGSGCGTISNALLLSDDQDAALHAADQAAADAAAAARDQLPGQDIPVAGGGITDPFTALADGNPVPLLLSILGLLLLIAAAGAGVLWWRRART